LSTPYYLRNGESYELQIRQVYSQRPCEQKPFKNLGEKGAGRNQGLPNFLITPLSQERTSNTHILNIDRNKSPLQISEEVAVG